MFIWIQAHTRRRERVSSSISAFSENTFDTPKSRSFFPVLKSLTIRAKFGAARRSPDRRKGGQVGNSKAATNTNRWIPLAFVKEEKNFPVFANAVQHTDLVSDPCFLDGKSRHATAAALVAQLDRTIGAQPLVPIANGGRERKFSVDSPFTIEEQPKVAPKVAPGLGEQTDDVLHELGLKATQINSLRTDGVVPASRRRESSAAD